MAGKNTAVFGIFKSRERAETAVERIAANGFTYNDISVLMSDPQSSKEFAHEKNTKAQEGTTTGAAAGGIIGGTLGLLAGIGALAIPGLGRLSRRDPSWEPWLVPALAARSVESLALWWAWESPNTKPNAMRAT